MKFFILSLLLVFSSCIFAGRLYDDNYTLGKPGSAADKTLKLGSTRQIRSNETSGKLEGSHDGSSFFVIDPASEPTQFNLLLNPDAEDSTNNWTFSGSGSFTTTTSDVYRGDNSFSLDGAAQNDAVISDQVAVLGLRNELCEARIKYKTSENNNYNVEILDSGLSVLGSSGVLPSSATDYTNKRFAFDCPALGTDTIAMRIIQTLVGDPAAIVFDEVSAGEPKNTGVAPAIYTMSVAQNFSDGVQTVINFDNVLTDEDALVTTGAGWIYTVPKDGLYKVTVKYRFNSSASWNPGEEKVSQLFVNGGNVAELNRWKVGDNTQDTKTFRGSVIKSLSKSDTLQVRLTQNSGAVQTLNGSAVLQQIEVTKVLED